MAGYDPNQVTQSFTDDSGSDAARSKIDIDSVEHPKRIGRYRVEKVLGRGGFGLVYLAQDSELDRMVAVKVPYAALVSKPEDADEYLLEARTVANLDHPHIVPVYDVGTTSDCYIVSKYIQGQTLREQLDESPPSLRESAELIAKIADAVHYAHKRGLVHRDIKPGNILIDRDRQPYVVDFGLALKESDVGKGPRYAGTPAYMSPEQARGEGHRVDRRSDVFSLGVVLYELLVNRKPFLADSKAELLKQITFQDPIPPSQCNGNVPKELERICLKSMSNRATDRYSTAKDLAAELRHFLSEWSDQSSSNQRPTKAETMAPLAAPDTATIANDSVEATSTASGASSADEMVRVVPKGLRSFDAHDADFFLELLPGARDRNGLPDVVRFWKTHIEETDPDETFSVGLIYGPSGCGKSSLVKAGLLPRLSDEIMTIYVECDGQETEARLLHRLRKQVPTLHEGADLPEILTSLRRGTILSPKKKVVIVLDQFEQWLHANQKVTYTQLVSALRQCDGKNLQCVIMVRDDFWMGVTRFMRELEVRLIEGQNSGSVDLFPTRHASNVLASFGRAFGDLPAVASEMDKEHQSFIQQAVEGLARDGKVICVRLALFAEMMKGKAWTPAVLNQFGGTSGVGVAFLEDTFSAESAAPEHRFHQKAARAVLQSLLPQGQTDIKGHMRSEQELLAVSGYTNRVRDFRDLMRILDQEVRLITPTDPDASEEDDEDILCQDGSTIEQIPATSEQRYFQLTHDYLVQPLRHWLTRKQRETRRGRAELRLVDYSEFWNAKPEKRRLPSWWEFLNMRLFTRKENWTAPQAAMMRRSATMFGIRAIILLAIAGLLGFIGYDLNGRIKADNIVRTLISAETQDVPMLVEDLQPYRRWADPHLRQALATRGPQEQLHASLALSVDDPLQTEFLTDALLRARPEDVPVILRFLKRSKKELVDRLWSRLDAPKQPGQRLRAASALAAFSPEDDKWKLARAEVAAELVNVPPVTAMIWIRNLRPANEHLLKPLKAIYRKRSTDNTERAIAAAALGDYLNDQPEELVELILLADSDDQYAPLRAELVRYPSQAVAGLTEALIAPVPRVEEEERNWHLKRQANAAVSLIDLGKGDSVWQVLRHRKNPSLRSYLIQRFGLLGAGLLPLIERLNSETDATVKTAIILALGEFNDMSVPLDRRTRLIDKLVRMYRRDPHPAIHSAVRWTAMRWGRDAAIKGSDTELLETGPQFDKRFAKDPRRWTVNSQGQLFAVIPGPVDLIRPKHRYRGTRHRERIPYGFAVSVHEVSVKQFLVFRPKHRYETEYSPQTDCPINNATWYDAAAYCNWLNEKEGIAKDQWCYEANSDGKYADGMTIAADWHKRRGYRLATEVELEYINRAGSQTRFGFGNPLELLEHYDWYVLNSQFRMWPVGLKKPNDLGMFDTHGNAWEWCHNRRNTTAGIGKSKEVIKNDLPRRARNGVFFYLATSVASHERKAFSPKLRSNNLSFRLVRRLGR